MDEIDITNQRMEREQEALLNAAVEQARAASGVSAEECSDCGEIIPEERRKAVKGCTRCAYCQMLHERQHGFRSWMRPFLK